MQVLDDMNFSISKLSYYIYSVSVHIGEYNT